MVLHMRLILAHRIQNSRQEPTILYTVCEASGSGSNTETIRRTVHRMCYKYHKWNVSLAPSTDKQRTE